MDRYKLLASTQLKLYSIPLPPWSGNSIVDRPGQAREQESPACDTKESRHVPGTSFPVPESSPPSRRRVTLPAAHSCMLWRVVCLSFLASRSFYVFLRVDAANYGTESCEPQATSKLKLSRPRPTPCVSAGYVRGESGVCSDVGRWRRAR
jgi:hypothetical protein